MKKLLFLLSIYLGCYSASTAQIAPVFELDPLGNGLYGATWYDVYGLNEIVYRTDTNQFTIMRGYLRVNSIGDTATQFAPSTAKPVYTDDSGRFWRGSSSISPTSITSISSSGFSFNTGYLVSTTAWSTVALSCKIACSLSLSGGQTGAITLYASPNNSTWNYVGEIDNSSTGTLTLGLNTVQVHGSQLSTILPPGYYWKLTSSGTGTFTFLGGQQVIY